MLFIVTDTTKNFETVRLPEKRINLLGARF